MLKKSILSLVIATLSIIIGYSDAPYFYEIAPKKGDGIISLMKRYNLTIHPCNTEKFLELNGLTMKSNIHTHKKYKLPIYIYAYDKKSIRSTIKIDDWEKAVRIKKYNTFLKSKGLRRKNYMLSKYLWVPYHEVGCGVNSTITKVDKKSTITKKKDSLKNTKKVEPTIKPINKNSLYVALFGKKHAEVKIIDMSLKGEVYYVVAGHGGPDPGARCIDCPSTLCEDEYAYDISLRLARDLMQHGAKVHVIIQDANDGIRDNKYFKCDQDEKCLGKLKIPLNQKARLQQRSGAINRFYQTYLKKGISDAHQTAIFIHVDSNVDKTKRQDVYFYHKKKSKAGKKLAQNVRNTFEQKYALYQKNRGYKGTIKTRGLYVLNHTLATSVFVELANIQNKKDHEKLIRNTNRQAIANWLFEGLTKK
ncbi:MAG: N-acetylmuramoyl-L-alanine amidase [Saprospiraceae bacterium]